MTKTLSLALLLAASPAGAVVHTVVKGEHLWGLAGQYYKNNFRWQAIHAANKDKIKDPHWIYPGQQFEIPDLPPAAIGELPARPVEAAAEVTAEEVQEAAPVAEAEAHEVLPDAAPEARKPPPVKTDDLSKDLPKGFVGQYPSMGRDKAPEGWDHDGKVTEFEGREMLAATGDWLHGEVEGTAKPGETFTVYRKAEPQELDDPKGTYLQKVGSVVVKEYLGRQQYRFQITKSVDSVQPGDLLKRDLR